MPIPGPAFLRVRNNVPIRSTHKGKTTTPTDQAHAFRFSRYIKAAYQCIHQDNFHRGSNVQSRPVDNIQVLRAHSPPITPSVLRMDHKVLIFAASNLIAGQYACNRPVGHIILRRRSRYGCFRPSISTDRSEIIVAFQYLSRPTGGRLESFEARMPSTVIWNVTRMKFPLDVFLPLRARA